jgi:hypothetical protein
MKHVIEPIIKVLHDLRNELWFSYHLNFRDLVQRWTPAALGIAALYPAYERLVDEADVSLEQVSKSFFTNKIQTMDRSRDECFRGLKLAVKSFLKSSDPQKKEAAEKLTILFDTYGDITKREYDAKSATIYNFLQEVQMPGKYSEDIKTMELTGWVNDLANYSSQFNILVDKRCAEKLQKPERRLVVVRRETDACYGKLITAIEVFMLTNPGHVPDDFIRELNTDIKHYKTVFAQTKGRRNSKKQKLQNTENVNENVNETINEQNNNNIN